MSTNQLTDYDLNEMLPWDPKYRKGVLPNGLTYYIRHNEKPKHQCSFHLIVRAGSLQEEDHESGYAHFLEHNAFNGSAHFPGNGIREYLETNGVSWGAELNAFTSYDRTVYTIDGVPTTKGNDLIANCIQILADWSGNLLLDQSALDKEKGIVVSEMIHRDSPADRMMKSMYPKLMPGSRYLKRDVVGSKDIVESCTSDTLRNFYKKWYHPKNQAVVVVGDIDEDSIEALIAEKFASFSSPENPAPVLEYSIGPNDEPIFASASDPEQRDTTIFVNFKARESLRLLPCYSLRRFIKALTRTVTVSLLVIRIAEDSELDNLPYLDIGFDFGNFLGSRNDTSLLLHASSKPGLEVDTYKYLLRQILRAARHGFSQEELDMCKKYICLPFQSETRKKGEDENDDLASDCREDFFASSMGLMGKPNYFSLILKHIDSITIDSINEFFRSLISEDLRNFVTFNYSPSHDGAFQFTEEIYRKATDEVLAEEIDVWQEPAQLLDDDIPDDAAGSIVEIRRDQLLGSTELTLSNGAKVYCLKNVAKKEEIVFSAYSLGGKSNFGDDDIPHFSRMARYIYSAGLADMTNLQLEKLMSKNAMDIDLCVDDECHGLCGYTIPQSLEVFLRVVNLFFRKPGKSKSDFDKQIERDRNSLETADLNPKSKFDRFINGIRYRDCARKLTLTPDTLSRIDLDRMRELYMDLFSDASGFMFFIVGNYDEDVLFPLVAKYIGTLPSTYRNLTFRPGSWGWNPNQVFATTEQKMETPESNVTSCYTTLVGQPYNPETILIYQVITAILDIRVRDEVRERNSIAYSTGCSFKMYFSGCLSDINIVLSIGAPVKPQYGMAAVRLIDQVVEDTLSNGFTDSELSKIRKNYQKDYKTDIEDNVFLRDTLWNYYLLGRDCFTNREQILSGITVEKLNDQFRWIIGHSFKQVYVMLPEGVEQEKL